MLIWLHFFCLILSGFEPAFLYIILCFGVFLASCVLLWLIGANIWKLKKKKEVIQKADDSCFRQIWCWLGLASLKVAASLSGMKPYLRWYCFFLALDSRVIYSSNNLDKASDNQTITKKRKFRDDFKEKTSLKKRAK